MRSPRGLRAPEALECRALLSTLAVVPAESSITEGARRAVFVATLDEPSANDVVLRYSTLDGTAKAGSDYASTSGTLTIPAGSTSATFSVRLLDDLLSEGAERFFVRLKASGAALSADRIVERLLDNDSASVSAQAVASSPTVTISDATISEGKAGTTRKAVLVVRLSEAATSTVRIKYTTTGVTATSNGGKKDYVAASGVLKIKAGSTVGRIRLTIVGDRRAEGDEVVNVKLTRARNATLGTDASGHAVFSRVVIRDDDTKGLARPTLSVSSPTATAGDSASFVVSLSSATKRDVTVRYTTVDGSANSSDYTTVAGILTIPAGSTSATIAIPTSSNAAGTAFSLVLSTPANAVLGAAKGTATIVSKSVTPSIGVAGVSASEVVSTADFVVALSAASASAVTVNYATADGTATAGSDYTAVSGTLTFAPGETSKTIAVAILNDTTYEPDESFTLNLSSPTNATLAVASAVATIVNDDAEPSLSIAGGSVAEGDSGTTALPFIVTLTNPSSTAITVNYATTDGTAIAGSDYTSASGTLTFAPGETSKTIGIAISGDSAYEADESFAVGLSSASGATIATASATGTIVNDDPSPSLSIASASTPEGASGTTTALTFTVTRTGSTELAGTVAYETVDGTAEAGQDYESASGTLTFAAGESSKAITVNVIGNDAYEAEKAFSVVLSDPVNLTLATSTATGTIVNDDTTPGITVAAASATEGDSGTTTLTFTVSLTKADDSASTTVDYATLDGTAQAGSDYEPASGTLTFAPGETSKTVSVTIYGDTAIEADEAFTLALSNPSSNAVLLRSSATGTIVNDDFPTLSIADASIVEGNSGTSSMLFTVTLSAASPSTIAVNYATSDGTATAGSDYTATSGTLTFAPGETTRTIAVPILGDTMYEPTEAFTIALSNPSKVVLGASTATGTITNDDPRPTISVVGVSTAEGSSGSKLASFTVSLSNASSSAITVGYATADGTATAGTDYTGTLGTLTFAPGETSKTVGVSILGDTTYEPDETFTLNLSSPSNATIAVASATGTITNDDPLPSISIAGGSVAEGNSGTTTLPFTVTLSNASSTAITVNYATTDGTATAGSDYTSASGTLTFAPGETSKTIGVSVIGDTTVEANETVWMVLSSASGATIATSSVTGTIVNDDASSAVTLSNNLSATSGGTEAATGSTWLTASFTTDSSSYSLSSITLLVSASSTTASATVYLYSDGGLQPGSLVGALTSPSSYSTSLSQSTFTASGISLSASSTYWVVLVANSGTFNWSWTTSNSGSGSGFTYTWGNSADAGATWFTYDIYPTQMDVEATKTS